MFVIIGPRYTWGLIYGSGCLSVSTRGCAADLTDVTLADEDTNSILADNANRTIQDSALMQVAPHDDQILKQIGATCWHNL